MPANLRDQWQEALDHFFHIPATVVAGHLVPALERRLLPGHQCGQRTSVVVTSIDYLKTRTETVLSHDWDAVIIDEAHLCAKPHDIHGSDSDMERHLFAKAAAARCRHLLLLTATPHNGYSDSYASLLEMLGPELVENSLTGLRVRRSAAEGHVVQRRRSDIEAWYEERGTKSPFPRRDADEVLVDLVEARGQRGGLVRSDLAYLLSELGGYTGSLLGQTGANHINGWIAVHLQRRALSSPRAIQRSLPAGLTR